jgi:hypothetical protein
MGHIYLAPNSKNHLCYFHLVFLAHYSIILWIAFIYSSDVSTKLQHRLNMEKDEMDKTVIVSKLLRLYYGQGQTRWSYTRRAPDALEKPRDANRRSRS